MVTKQGTAIGSAIDLGIRSFTPGLGESKAMIIISDGENHEDDPLAKAKEAMEAGIVIYTIGIGSTEGVPIPVTVNGKKDFLKNADGNTVITKLDENMLRDLAVTANGKYVRASNSNIGLDEVFSDIAKLKKQELEGKMYTEYNEQFQIFAGSVLLLLLVDFLIMERRNRRLSNLRIFKFRI